MSETKGFFVMIDGLDGSGKTTIIQVLTDYLKTKGEKIFELREYWKHSNSLPEPEELYGYDFIISAEPTYSLVGGAIRDELIRQNKRQYSALITATAYALDRLILYRRIIIPLLEQGKTIIQDRGITTSVVYQPIQAEPLELETVLSMEGNQLALKYRPDLIIITDVSPEMCAERLVKRVDKKDNVIFDNLDFQKKAHERFKSSWFAQMFIRRGSKIVYLDTSKSKEEIITDVIKLYDDFLGDNKLDSKESKE